MPTGIHIIQITAHTVIIPVQCQWFPDIPQVAVLGEEAGCHHAVVPCAQVLAVDVGVVRFPVIGVLVLIGGGSVGQFARDGILVGLREMPLGVRQACHAAPGITG